MTEIQTEKEHALVTLLGIHQCKDPDDVTKEAMSSVLDTYTERIAQEASKAERERIRQWALGRAIRCAACLGHKTIPHNHPPSDISDLLELVTPKP